MAFSWLFEPVVLGALRLHSWFVMAPMTRSRARPDCTLPESALTY